jgi:membrane-associated protease RseP (regulator of RpoE activity)
MSNLNSSINHLFSRREAMRPTAWTWAKHLLLLALTFVTVTIAGSMQPFGGIELFPNIDPQIGDDFFSFLLVLPGLYVDQIVSTIGQLLTDWTKLEFGLSFSLSLLFILTCHEMGHYVACRLYGVDATLPFFIPTPPLIGPAGTFGAFIKIVSPLPSRRATFDIGVAGPIAGFVALIPVAVVGLLTMKRAAPEHLTNAQTGLHFADPLLTRALGYVLNADPSVGEINAFYAAAWLGLLVTALNLIPSGQLDGGHAVFSVFGERVHFWTGRVAFAVMVTFAVAGFYFYNSPSGILFAILLGVMMRVRHPQPLDPTPLDAKRLAVAALTLLIFILSFTPFPIQIR